MTRSTDHLQLALAAEHAAIYAYGVIGAQLTDAELTDAQAADRQHRQQRDSVADLIAAAGTTPTAAAAAYQLPQPVTDRAGALALAVGIETKAAAVWRATLGEVSGPARELALGALVGSAVLAATWRKASSPEKPPTVVWPGG